MMRSPIHCLVAALGLLPLIVAQCTTINPANPVVMASGYQSRVFINGLRTPRGITQDTLGNILVVEQGSGVRQIKITDNGGINVCAGATKQLISDNTLNHGIQVSADGKTLYVSSLQNVYAYPYDAAAGTVGTRTTVINGMNNGGLHLTRTLLIPKAAPNLLLVQRGSDGNIDATTTQQSSGRSQTRIFDLTTIGSGGVAYTSGQVLGWGLRNSVGLGEDISTGGIWSVENSVDDMRKGGQDVHNDNPGEELNYHGVITNTSAIERGANYGYPDCFAAWKMNNIPVGTQFAIDSPSGGSTDATCASTKMAPKLTFPSHTAPLDVKFRADGTAAFISFHGSWDRQPPDGYRLSQINFANGQPREGPTSSTAAINIMTNQNNANCPGRCFRPVGLIVDSKNRIYMSSDASNEIFIITGP